VPINKVPQRFLTGTVHLICITCTYNTGNIMCMDKQDTSTISPVNLHKKGVNLKLIDQKRDENPISKIHQ